MIHIAIAQICSKSDCAHNLQICTAVIKRAAQKNTEIVFFPECTDIVFAPDYDKEGERENPTNINHFLEGIRNLAKEYKLYIVLGAHTADPNDAKKWQNSALTYSPDGQLIHQYDKLHPCVVSLGEGMEVDERGSCASGSSTQDGLKLLQIKAKSGEIWKFGIAICYDVRFGDFAAYHRKNGCDAIVYLTAWFPYTRAHWDPLITARAIDNQSYVIAPGQYGDHDETRASLGASAIIAPSGQKIVSLPTLHHKKSALGDELNEETAKDEFKGSSQGQGGQVEPLEEYEDCWIGFAALDAQQLKTIRNGIPMEEFCRNEVYGQI